MREATVDKLHIFLAMFCISLIMSMQGPIFTPYAAMLGASSVLIGIMLSASQLANLTGNLIVGPLIDRFGKRMFITLPIIISGILFISHGLVSNAFSLLALRTMNGFTLAFLMPTALALLSGYASNSRQQGKNMAINSMIGMVASIIAPLVGGQLGSSIGYANTYFLIGSALILTALYTLGFIRDRQVVVVKKRSATPVTFLTMLKMSQLQLIYLTAFAVMYIHGGIIYEIPYLTVEQGLSTVHTGRLFSIMAIGTLFSLSFFFVHRFDAVKRMMFGVFGMSLSLFAIFSGLLSLPVLLFLIGICFGIIMPAVATAITDTVAKNMHGRAFGTMSAVYSSGMIVSSFITGIIRDIISPYFIAFLIGMLSLTLVGYLKLQATETASSNVYE